MHRDGDTVGGMPGSEHRAQEDLGAKTELDPVLILANPKSGGGLAGELVPYLIRELGELGYPVEVFQSSAAGQITRRVLALRAAEEAHTALCIVGGDGTIREALQGRPPDMLPLAVLPTGTANVLAQEFKLPKNPCETAHMIERGKTLRMDLGVLRHGPESRSEVMALMVGTGIDSQIIERVHNKRGGSTFGKLAYLGPITMSLIGYKKHQHYVILEDGQRHGPFAQVVVANIAGYGGVWRMPGKVAFDDGLFDVYGFHAKGAFGLLKHGLKGALKKLEEGPELEHFQASRIRIEADGESPVQCDGDPAGYCPIEITVVPKALNLIIP